MVNNTLDICSNLNKILEQYGNINFLSKEELYLLIDYIRYSFKISINDVFNVPRFCQDNFKDIIVYDFHKFNDTKIGGFLVKNKIPEKSYITVNASKDPISTVFDLTHEMIHFLLHPEDRNNYISSSLCDIDNFEWQANEGAAELLVPYKCFIPNFVKNIKKCNSRSDFIDLLNYLSDKYKVSTAVLEYRISGLKYEINQYENNIPIDKIKFLSKKAQEEQGIFIKSYTDIFNMQKLELKSIIANFSSGGITNNKTHQLKTTVFTDGQNKWNDFLMSLKASGKIVLYTSLLNTELITLNENTVGINFIKGLTPFVKFILAKELNIKTIEKYITSVFHKNMNIKLIDNSSKPISINLSNKLL